jgi:hypothetical protein
LIPAQDLCFLSLLRIETDKKRKELKMANTITQTNENKVKSVFKNTRSKNTEPSKDEWIQYHAKRIHTFWLQWQTPLGIAYKYVEQIKKDLAKFYDDPLKRNFIETTYC